MSANIKHTEHSAPAVALVPKQQSADDSGQNGVPSLMVISAGPAALSQLALYDAMEMYLNIIGLDAEQRKNWLKAQTSEVQATASALISSGTQAGIGLIVGGASTAVAAGAGIFTTLYPMKSERDAQAKVDDMEDQLKPLRSLSEEFKNPSASELEMGEDGEASPVPVETPAVANRIAQLKRGQYYKIEKEEKDKPAYKPYDKQENKDAIALVKDKNERAQLRAEINAEIDRKERAMNSYAQQVSTKGQIRQTLTGALTTAGNSASQVAQGATTIQKVQYDAISEIARTVNGQDGSAAQTMDQQMSKAYENGVAEVTQILQKIQDSQRV